MRVGDVCFALIAKLRERWPYGEPVAPSNLKLGEKTEDLLLAVEAPAVPRDRHVVRCRRRRSSNRIRQVLERETRGRVVHGFTIPTVGLSDVMAR